MSNSENSLLIPSRERKLNIPVNFSVKFFDMVLFTVHQLIVKSEASQDLVRYRAGFGRTSYLLFRVDKG